MKIGEQVFFLKNAIELNACDCWECVDIEQTPKQLSIFKLQNKRTGQELHLTRNEIEYNKVDFH